MSSTPPPNPPPARPHDQAGGVPPPQSNGVPQGPWSSDFRSAPAAAGAGTFAQPPSIATAVKLMYVGAAISALSAILTLFQRDAIEDAVRDSDSGLTNSEVDSAVAAGIAFAIVIGLVAVGVWLWMARANGQGKRWARTVATVLGVLNVLFTLLNLAGGMDSSTGLSNGLAVIGAIVAAAVLYFLWRPDATQYYDANSPRR